MKSLKALGVVGAAIFTLTVSEMAAAEQSADYERTATVQSADLDLTRERDVRVLYERIRYAASALCVGEESTFDAQRAPRRRRCVQAAIDGAIERTDLPLLTAVHLQRNEQLARL